MSNEVDANGTKRQVTVQTPIAAIRQQLSDMGGQFRAALPAHIPVERFSRVVMTAVQNNPELLECDQRSLWNAAMKAAQDGLLPDGREGAITVRKDWKKGTKLALWQLMIAGIRKKARNSGEIATWDAHAVFENDLFKYELGDEPFVRHKPGLRNHGQIIAAYSVCTLKSGEKTREIMSIEEMHDVRDRYSDGWKAFKAGLIKSTPWSTSEEEMCRKTVARRHSKVLPMSSDLDDLIRRDDSRLADETERQPRIKTLEAKLNALAGNSNGGGEVTDETQAKFGNGPDREPPHDPETGEIMDPATKAWVKAGQPLPGPEDVKRDHEAALADPTGEEAGRLLAPKLDERAQQGATNSNQTTQSGDPRIRELLEEARAKATEGAKKFKPWVDKLSAPDFERLGPHFAALHNVANAADEMGK